MLAALGQPSSATLGLGQFPGQLGEDCWRQQGCGNQVWLQP